MNITQDRVERLVEIESEVHYRTIPPDGTPPFVVASRRSPVIISAPHGARVYRNTADERWHDDEEYTAGLALLLGELCCASAIATVWQTAGDDPNYCDVSPYKRALEALIASHGARFVLDLHGAAINSARLRPGEMVDLGYRSEQGKERSMREEHVARLESLLQSPATGCEKDCFVVGRNALRAATSGTVTTFAHQHGLQALQIEIKPQVRVARRFPTSTLYRTCGDYAADLHCVMHLIQALADFVDYLSRA